MASLYKRATPSQAKMLRAIAGAWSRVPRDLVDRGGVAARFEADTAAGIKPDRVIKDLGLRRWHGEMVYVTRQLRKGARKYKHEPLGGLKPRVRFVRVR